MTQNIKLITSPAVNNIRIKVVISNSAMAAVPPFAKRLKTQCARNTN